MPLRNPLNEHDHYHPPKPVNGPNREQEVFDNEALAARRNEAQLRREAMGRLNRILVLLDEKSTPEIETKIDVLKPYRPHTWPFVKSHLWSWWKPPAEGVSISSYSYGNHPADREVHYEVLEENVPGWAIPFALGGRKATSMKDIANRHKPTTLIVEKKLHPGQRRRSWMGGYEAKTEGEPTILAKPERMAVGEGLTSGAQGGFFGDNAIEGLGRLDNPRFNNTIQIDKVWTIGNALISYGESVGLGEVLSEEDLLQDIRETQVYKNLM